MTLEERFDINLWKGEFTSKYLEELCRKTGKERTYIQFLQLLTQSIDQSNPRVFIDLLGYSDLQLLKA